VTVDGADQRAPLAQRLARLATVVDPRTRLPVPPLGELPRLATLGDLVTRVLAPNPSMMALDGTNTYVICAPGAGEAAVVDPGPPDEAHLSQVESVLAGLGAECRWILVTHHHIDHSGAALPWADRLGAQVGAAARRVAGPRGRLLDGGDEIRVGGTTIGVVPTPGHCSDHLAFRLETGGLLTGDHILGRGSSVVTYPDGDLIAYLESLRRVLDLGPSALYPGHGPAMTEDPVSVVRFYLHHRELRRQQILTVLADGPADPPTLVRHIYHDTPVGLRPYAEQSTRAALHAMAQEGVIELEASGVAAMRQVA
jgi:glyoxylase-like metal-dependent hydrolase (beta-lactamase superfamily II)